MDGTFYGSWTSRSESDQACDFDVLEILGCYVHECTSRNCVQSIQVQQLLLRTTFDNAVPLYTPGTMIYIEIHVVWIYHIIEYLFIRQV